jgi:hypothetical protein
MIFDELKGKDAGLFHTINGYIFGNLPGLVMTRGERARWYLLGMGNEKDLHTPHWHGKTVEYRRRHTDVIELLPASMVSVDMVADNSGTWLSHCQVSDHMEAGMMATYTIYQPDQPCSSPIQFVSADFWTSPGKFRVTVRNVGSKAVRNVVVNFDHLMAPQYRRRPFNHEWIWNTPMRPGQEQTFEMSGYVTGRADTIFGFLLFPTMVVYEDGSKWWPRTESECFAVYWRDKEHPQLTILPPLQFETTED